MNTYNRSLFALGLFAIMLITVGNETYAATAAGDSLPYESWLYFHNPFILNPDRGNQSENY